MKYLKTFENKNENYKIGDYVIINKMSDHNLILRGFPADESEENYNNTELIVKLIKTPSIWKDDVKINFKMKMIDYLEKKSKPYTGLLPNDKNIIRLYKTDIIRKLSPKEIEQYKISKDSNKYNI